MAARGDRDGGPGLPYCHTEKTGGDWEVKVGFHDGCLQIMDGWEEDRTDVSHMAPKIRTEMEKLK